MRVHSRFMNSPADLDPSEAGLLVVPMHGLDERSLLPLWDDLERASPGRIARVALLHDGQMLVERAGSRRTSDPADPEGLQNLVVGADKVTVAYSALPYAVWMPIVSYSLRSVDTVDVLYVEPDSYREHGSPSTWSWFDLTSDFGDTTPLPGFASLAPPDPCVPQVLVMFLGFEGSRARYLAALLDPRPQIVPVIGAPSFRPEYVNFAIACNRAFLEDEDAFPEVRTVPAGDPFQTCQLLASLSKEFNGAHLHVGLSGTRAHALGALMFHHLRPADITLMYDHPKEKHGRTRGVAGLHVQALKEGGTVLFEGS